MTELTELTKESTDRFAEVDGIRIHYNESGSGPALICTHGGGPGANAWDNTKYAFAGLARSFRVLLMDYPGFGESQQGVSRDGVPVDVYCARLTRRFMDAVGIERAHLYGSSAFSAAALRFGLEYPDHVGKIVIQAYGPGKHAAETEGLKSLATFSADPSRQNMQRMIELFVPRPELRPPEFVDARWQSALTPGHLASRREFSARANSDLAPDLGGLSAEVLVLWGVADNMIPVAEVLDALRMIPDVRAYIWGGASGHFVAYEHADEFTRVVTDFLTH
jgi:4,5:9,10-diseco-3-hydroxy-5,9,17-trioxoandrosta-1(10),2-diene-4-oate hydrolase